MLPHKIYKICDDRMKYIIYENDRKFCQRGSNFDNVLYAPNFRKVEGAYCFGLDRPSFRLSVRPCVRASVQNLLSYSFEFQIWIPHQKIIDTYFLSLDYLSFWSYAPF